jgi:hypothetical protein
MSRLRLRAKKPGRSSERPGDYDDNGDVEFYAFLSSAAIGVAFSPASGLGRPRLSRI